MKRSDVPRAAVLVPLLVAFAGCSNKPGPTGTDPASSSGSVGAAAPAAKPGAPGQPALDPLNPRTDLRSLGLYLQQHAKNGRAPARLEDLGELKRELAKVYQAVQDGAYVVRWNAPLTGDGILLAYERDAPTKGGAVLANDGSVRIVTAEEFRTLPGVGK